MEGGWIKLYRKLRDNPIFFDEALLQLWIYCLLTANHAAEKVFLGKDEITVMRGQFVTGRFCISLGVRKNPNTTYKRLKKLEKLGFLNIKSNNKNSLITVVNYELYQCSIDESNSTLNNKVTTREQQSNNKVTQTRSKEVKELKELKKKDIYSDCVKLTKDEYQKLIDKFGKVGADERIENLSLYLKAKGDKYKSHYATILMWEKKNSTRTINTNDHCRKVD